MPPLRIWRRLLIAATAITWSASAHAHGEAVVLGVLLYFGLGGGVLGGITVVVLGYEKLSFASPFAAFLAVLSVIAVVWAKSVEIIPYAIGYGAFAAVLPFVLAYYGSRFVAKHFAQAIRRRKEASSR